MTLDSWLPQEEQIGNESTAFRVSVMLCAKMPSLMIYVRALRRLRARMGNTTSFPLASRVSIVVFPAAG